MVQTVCSHLGYAKLYIVKRMHCFIFLLALCSWHLRQSVHFNVATNDIVSRLTEVHCSNTWLTEHHHLKFQMSSPDVTDWECATQVVHLAVPCMLSFLSIYIENGIKLCRF